MQRTYALDILSNKDETVLIKGWVNSRRDHGGLIFIDIRDHTGVAQLTIQPEAENAFKIAEGIRDEYVISAKGIVKERAENLKNPNLETGEVEIVVDALEILNKSEALPIQVNSDQHISEEHRLKYRYLDLRRPKMQTMLKNRARYYSYIRNYMEANTFIEVATPILANSSPEGARDFLVPSRVHIGKFYALPQAPQQFKQLLMVGGIPRYYQIATCFRDEDPRADRLYGDFYQLDLEMSFVDDGEEVRTIMEPLIKNLVTDFSGKKLMSEEIPRITYRDSMDRFGTDKPDLRFDMELVDLTEELKTCGFGVFCKAIESGGVVKAINIPGAGKFTRSQLDNLTDLAKQQGAGGLPYMQNIDGQLSSSITKFFEEETLNQVKTKMNSSVGDLIVFGSDSRDVVNKTLGTIRNTCADILELKDPNLVALAWVVDFPFYEWDESHNKMDFGHNPFSMPKGGVEVLEGTEDKLSIVADQYDMVMNGYEICSGAVRNHNPEILKKVFAVLGYDEKYVESKFGAMLNAFRFGAPPHAGCAFGLDRIFMVLMAEENIREVIAFPKNGSGIDVMMNSPSLVDADQLKELGIRFIDQ